MELASADLILAIGILLLGLAAGAAVTILLLRRSPRVIPGVARSDRFGAALIAGGATAVGTIAVGNAVGATRAWFSSGPVTVTAMDRSVAETASDAAALDHVTAATSGTVDVTIADLPLSSSVWLWLADLLPILIALTACILAVRLAAGLLRGRPFTRRFPVALVIFAGVVMACGVGAGLAAAIGRAEAALFLQPGGTPDPVFAPFLMTIDLSPFGWGLLIGLLAGAFQLGMRLQRDTEGLV